MSLSEAYLNRLNRYGESFQGRIQGQREADWRLYKQKSTYRVEFKHEGRSIVGVLEPNKQDATQTSAWLLVDLDEEHKAGEIFSIGENFWMVWFKRESESKGYNKYQMLKMSHLISWEDREKKKHRSLAYFSGKMTRIIYDVARNTASAPNYQEPSKETHLIMPVTNDLKREDYIEIDGEGFLVTGYDLSSVPGVIYFSLKETYIHDNTPAPRDDGSDQTFWLRGDKL